MKKSITGIIIFLFVLVILLIPFKLFGQTVVITAATSAAGQPMNYGSYQIQYVPPTGFSSGNIVRKDTGAVLTYSDKNKTGSMDSSGNFSVTLIRPDNISPTGGFWKLTLCPLATSPCSVQNITSSSINAASASLTFLAPAMSVIASPEVTKAIPKAHRSSDVIGAVPGSIYYDLTLDSLCIYNVLGTWSCGPDLTAYAKLNGSNQPFTGTVAAPEFDLKQAGVIKGQLYYDGVSSIFFLDESGQTRLEFDTNGATYLQGYGTVNVNDLNGSDTNNIFQALLNGAVKFALTPGGQGMFNGDLQVGSAVFGGPFQVYLDGSGGIGKFNGGINVPISSPKFIIDTNGRMTKVNNQSTLGNGTPLLVAIGDSTGLTAQFGSSIIYSVPASSGQYRINWNAKITTAATTSSTLGTFQVTYTDPDGTVITATGFGSTAGSLTTSSTANTTSTYLAGVPMLLNCKASTNISIQFNYTSSGATPMAYNFHYRLEAL